MAPLIEGGATPYGSSNPKKLAVGITIDYKLISMVEKCELIGDDFSWFVQFCLGCAAFTTLLVKWLVEKPRRRFVVWFVDICKQGSSGCVNHFMNIGIATLLTSAAGSDADECAWYFVNFSINTIGGGVICWLLVRLVERAAASRKWPCCRGRAACAALAVSGEYGQNAERAVLTAADGATDEWMRTSWDSRGRNAAGAGALLAGEAPGSYAAASDAAAGGAARAQCTWTSCTQGLRLDWAVLQMVVWIVIIAAMCIALAAPLYLLRAPLASGATAMFKPLADWSPKVELVVVMVACPFLLNTCYYWIMCVAARASAPRCPPRRAHGTATARRARNSPPTLRVSTIEVNSDAKRAALTLHPPPPPRRLRAGTR